MFEGKLGKQLTATWVFVIIEGFAFIGGRGYLPNLKRCEWFAAGMTGPRLIPLVLAFGWVAQEYKLGILK